MAKSEYWLKMAEEDLKDGCKAILSSLWIESGKTHFPSSVLELMVMRGNKFQLSRHGWETVDKIIMPSEIYDANKAGALFSNAKEVMELGRKFLTKS